MPDKRTHRGPHPQDNQLFADDLVPVLRQATADLAWLLTRGYTEKAALKLVGDRFCLTARQRLAVMRAACSDQQLASRRSRLLPPGAIRSQDLAIDGYNLLITIEAALSNAVLIRARDGCIRDIASIHGTYRKVQETIPAIKRIASYVLPLGPRNVLWLLDSPVSNSGRLRSLILDIGKSLQANWDVHLLPSPDTVLSSTQMVVASTDGVVLDTCNRWVSLAEAVIEDTIPHPHIIDLADRAWP